MLISFSRWHWYADIVVTDANALAGTNFQLFGLASDGSEVGAETRPGMPQRNSSRPSSVGTAPKP